MLWNGSLFAFQGACVYVRGRSCYVYVYEEVSATLQGRKKGSREWSPFLKFTSRRIYGGKKYTLMISDIEK